MQYNTAQVRKTNSFDKRNTICRFIISMNWYVSDPNEFFKKQRNKLTTKLLWETLLYRKPLRQWCRVKSAQGQWSTPPELILAYVTWRKLECCYSSWMRRLSTTTNTKAFFSGCLIKLPVPIYAPGWREALWK